jgi:hypothetical protein
MLANLLVAKYLRIMNDVRRNNELTNGGQNIYIFMI